MAVETPASLLQQLRQPNERAAWGRFVRLYTPLLYHWACRLGLQEADAADLVQDVFLVLYRKLPEFEYDRQRSFRGWLHALFVNRWRDGQRRRRPVVASALPSAAGPDTTHAVDEAEYREFLVGRALRLMQGDFAETTWRACWAHLIDGESAAEVAARFGLTPAAVYAAKSRVLRRLRAELDGLLD